MEYLGFYKEREIKEDNVFRYLLENLKPSIKVWEYFVNWQKVTSNLEGLKIELNILNSLIGSSDLKKDFVDLILKYPNVVRVLPALLAVRESSLEVLKNYKSGSLDYLSFDFENVSDLNKDSAERYYEFVVKSGLINLFENKNVKNFVDYVFGVEVGLDSNGRKNRGGTLMENIVEVFVEDLIKSNKDLAYVSQATPKKIKEAWNFNLKFNKSARSFDFAIYNLKKKKLVLIETNFFNGGGSKLKSVCGEFKSLHRELKSQNIDLVWITDGFGWKSTNRPLEEAFENNDFIFNLNMVREGVLEEIVK